MSERAQMIHMFVRISRLAAERWQVQLSEAVTIPESSGALGYIAHIFGLFHMEAAMPCSTTWRSTSLGTCP